MSFSECVGKGLVKRFQAKSIHSGHLFGTSLKHFWHPWRAFQRKQKSCPRLSGSHIPPRPPKKRLCPTVSLRMKTERSRGPRKTSKRLLWLHLGSLGNAFLEPFSEPFSKSIFGPQKGGAFHLNRAGFPPDNPLLPAELGRAECLRNSFSWQSQLPRFWSKVKGNLRCTTEAIF